MSGGGYEYSALPMTPRQQKREQKREQKRVSGLQSAKKHPSGRSTRRSELSGGGGGGENERGGVRGGGVRGGGLSARGSGGKLKARTTEKKKKKQSGMIERRRTIVGLREHEDEVEEHKGGGGAVSSEVDARTSGGRRHPKTSRALTSRRSEECASPDLWVDQRRQRMTYDREGLKTAGPSSRPSSRPNSRPDDSRPDDSRPNDNKESSNGTSSETRGVESGSRPASMAVRSRANRSITPLSSINKREARSNELARLSLTASPLQIQGGGRQQLGVLRGTRMKSPSPILKTRTGSSSGGSSSNVSRRSLRGRSAVARLVAREYGYLSLSATAHSSATTVQRWLRKIRPSLGQQSASATTAVTTSVLASSPAAARRLSSSSSKRRRRSFSSSSAAPTYDDTAAGGGGTRRMRQLPSFMRLLETQPTSPTGHSGSSRSVDESSGTQHEDPPVEQIRSRVLAGHTSTISDICVIRDGGSSSTSASGAPDAAYSSSKMAYSSASLDGTVRLWDAQTGESVSTLHHRSQQDGSNNDDVRGGDDDVVSVLALDSTQERSPMLFTGCADGSLWSWDAAVGKMTKRIGGAHGEAITSIKVAAMETSRVVTGSTDNTVKVWDLRQRRPLVYTLRGHSAPVTSLKVEETWGRIFSGSKDQSLRVWDIRTGRQTHALQDHFGSVQCIVTSPHTLKGYVSGARDSSIKFWNMEGQCMRTIRAHKGVVYDMALQPLVVGGGGGGGEGFVMGSGGIESSEGTSGGSGMDVGMMDDSIMATARGGGVLGPLLASGGADGKLKLWDCTRKKCVSELVGHRAAIYACKWAGPDCVVSASADCTVRAWDVHSGQSLTLVGHTSAVTHIHCDSEQILSASKDATMRLWSVGIAFGL